MYYGIFAYELTKKPPKTVRPNEHIYVTFCYDRSCSSHPLDGSRCTTQVSNWYENSELSEMVKTWLSMTENVYVYYYGMPNLFLTMSYIHTVRDDVRFIHDVGVKGICWESHFNFFETPPLALCLYAELIWDTDMSDEEYDGYYDRLLHTFYGSGAPFMREYISINDRVHECGPCYMCWGGMMHPIQMVASVDEELFAANYDALFDLIENATALADTAKQEQRMTVLSCSTIYKGSICAYPAAKAAGDAARMAQLCERYDLINERLSRYGMDMTNGTTMTGLWPCDYALTLKEIFPD